MPDSITMAELLEGQRALAERGRRLIDEKDTERRLAEVAALARDGRALEELARRFEAQELAKASPTRPGEFEVALTEAQRQRIFAATGVMLETIWVEDLAGTRVGAMPHTRPEEIERLALHVAAGRARGHDQAAAKGALATALAALEESPVGQVREQLALLQAEPWFQAVVAQTRR